MNQQQQRLPLLVEVYLHGGLVRGVTREVEQRRRLVDVLNSNDKDFFELEAATMSMPGLEERYFPITAIDKSAILAAIPHETREQTRHRALLNTGIGRSSATIETPMGFLLPPLYFEGTAYVPPGSGLGNKPNPAVFSRFFAITGANLYLPDGSLAEESIVLLNRDNLALLSLLSDLSLRRVA